MDKKTTKHLGYTRGALLKPLTPSIFPSPTKGDSNMGEGFLREIPETFLHVLLSDDKKTTDW